jgi:TRAP-type C4-dicarboxylate transport system substrate-binding protein
MSRGTIDGQLQGWTGMRTFGGFEVANASYVVPLGASPFLLLMNLDLWNSLPEDVQEVMMRHAGEQLGAYGGGRYDEITEGIIAGQAEDADYTITYASDEDIAAYAEDYSIVHERWIEANDNGQAVYDTFMQLLDEYRNGG